MRKIILLIIVVAIASASVYAQEKKRVPRSAEDRTEKLLVTLSEKLALNDEQKTKVKGIVLKHEKVYDDLKNQFAENKDALKEANKKNRKEAEEELKALLTAEQVEKLMLFKEERQKKMERRASQKNVAGAK